MKQSVVAQSTMQAEMIGTVYGNVQINWAQDLTIAIQIASKDITRRNHNDGRNCIMTLISCNFQSDNRNLGHQYHTIHKANATGANVIMHLRGTEILADALTSALWGVTLCEFDDEIGLG